MATAAGVRDSYQPYLRDLQDIQALASDLTPAGIDSAKPAMEKRKKNGDAAAAARHADRAARRGGRLDVVLAGRRRARRRSSRRRPPRLRRRKVFGIRAPVRAGPGPWEAGSGTPGRRASRRGRGRAGRGSGTIRLQPVADGSTSNIAAEVAGAGAGRLTVPMAVTVAAAGLPWLARCWSAGAALRPSARLPGPPALAGAGVVGPALAFWAALGSGSGDDGAAVVLVGPPPDEERDSAALKHPQPMPLLKL